MTVSMALNLFSHLRSVYGPEILSVINTRIYLCKLEASWINHRIFNLRCIQMDIVPKTLHVRPPDNSERSRQAAHVAERTFLRQRTHHCTVRLQEIRQRVSRLDMILQELLEKDDLERVSELVARRFAQRVYSVKVRQIRKFNKLLLAQDRPTNTPRFENSQNLVKPIVNLSDRVLTKEEENLLNKGLNYNISPGILKPLDVIPAVEEALTSLPASEANNARLQISKILTNQKPQKSNLTTTEKEALKALRSDRSIIVTKSDKGNQIVVMNREDYDQKAEEHIQSGPYKAIPKEKQSTVLNKTKAVTARFLGTVKQKLGKSLWFALYPKTSSASRFYGLPKIHKPLIPLRPIVDYTLSPTYRLAKYLAGILKPLEKETPHTVKNSSQVAEKLRELKVYSDECFVSFDVSSLFTNVPISDSLQILHQRLLEDSTLSSRTCLTIEEIIEATKLCIESTFFKFKGELYQQTAGLAMGSPISPIVANIFMQDFEQKMLVSFEQAPRIWWRYVDDTLVVIKRDVLDEFFQYLNNFHVQIEFTLEKESECGEIQFLDCNIRRKDDGSIDTSVHRKGSHSNRYLAFDSEHPLSTKKAVAKNLYFRAMNICNTELEKQHEIKTVTSILRANGYNESVLRDAQNAPLSSSVPTTTENREWLSTIVIPYRKTTSEDIRRVLNRYNIRVAFQASNTLRRQLVKLKDPVTPLEQTNCVYKLKCRDCEACYVGQTARELGVRVKEHQRDACKRPTDAARLKKLENDSAIAAHAVLNGHDIEFDRPCVLKQGFKTYKQRLLAESFLIHTTPGVVNRHDGSELSPFWQAITPSQPPQTSTSGV